MGGLQCSNELRNDGVLVRALSGSLDDQFDPNILDIQDVQYLVLDLQHITSVSSYGVREWIRALQKARQQLKGLYFVNVSPRMNDQFNMVMGFDCGGDLLSFYSYYVCESCDEESLILFDVIADRAMLESFEAPDRQCQFCGADAELDDDPSMLFEYSRGVEPPSPPAPVMATLRSPQCWLNQLPGLRLTTRQTIQNEVTRFALAGVIDENLSPRRMIQNAEGTTQLVLTHIQSLIPNGIARWRDLIQGITQRTQSPTKLAGAPPPVLRRFIDDPTTASAAELVSICLHIRCTECRSIEARVVQLQDMEAFQQQPGVCRHCRTPLDLQSANTLLTDLNSALETIQNQSGKVMPPPAPQNSPRRRAKQRKAQRTEQDANSKLFAGKYEVLCRLAQGGMAEVFIARQHGAMGFRRLAVIKSVRGELVTDDRMIRLFLDEAKLAARIDHPNVIRVYDLGREQGGFYMVLEYVHGRALSAVVKAALRKGEPLSSAHAAMITADLCKGLARAHQPTPSGKILVHRDVTLANVLMSFDGIVKLVDFGLAGHDQIEWDHGTILGSPAWIAPEIYTGAEAHPGADIWGAGLILMVLQTGKHPFVRKTTRQTAQAIVGERIKRGWSNPIPKKLFAIIERALDKDPTRRYQSAAEMESDLRDVIPELGPAQDLARYTQSLFADERENEQRFTEQIGAPSFIESLLSAKPEDVEAFFKGAEDLKKAS